MRAAVLQLSSQGMSSTKLFNYVRIAQKQGVKVLVLGEYTLSPFFKELQTMSIAMIKEQAEHQSKILKELSSTYNITIVAPIITVKKQEVYKMIAKYSPASTAYYQQQLLINYSHWNEEKFFANEIKPLESPLVFNVDGFKFAIMSGFELHFDEILSKLNTKNIDCILLPSVSTFDSLDRWKSLIQIRSFTHNYYILRANRIGEYKDKDVSWQFYGDSLLTSPYGEIIEHLGNREELMIVDMSHTQVVQARRLWGFKDAITKRH
ncbi:MAG: carbon-nitrogen hydrolase family protein [Sulfurimonas sp.]|nr:MAG: carbon-nitrogen hydrolase family protein [Sulfurimonas sp.]